MFVWHSSLHRVTPDIISTRLLYDGHTELPDSLGKATGHREAFAKSSWSHCIILCDAKIVSRWHRRTRQNSRMGIVELLVYTM